ncbi:long-chain fatty acid--CoA ligase [Mycobacterium sp. CBMA293]|uniref:long-chain-fatty-acid--CoA ligase n=1 Tax=unclassified Mycolicibacterium TaxID=2636767 RepID=UPI00132739AE|nr:MULTISPECIES: long-chain fatty acid--CoA ligase [unclassified Mycolicibacterium]MUL48239.1 long-chain fatty acid--CoA ligase [Mycolicibacterium sp. CBMA 360]MUL92681.1 long-chain fatty acid--CoA ligase [Mycolicibacterium sp. CBMA 230]MUL57593.1 long-chain fatty acid--CoA ligase [Mycolicibacterium sp. CBMA 335]MUL70633.1 long-chain fatty acid--CoA ligase [Mycolicibacterium sp. CBMA 311]MUM08306.1 long-chain-fatty-acid--CoA ligase [Mycolicibacterium sp. CBMA 213]
MLNLSVMLADSARDQPSATAVIEGQRQMTYHEINAAANQVAALLIQQGIAVGDRVAMSVPNILEFPIVYYGILKAGAVAVPLNTMLKRAEVGYHLTDSGARAYFYAGEYLPDNAWLAFEDVTTCEYSVAITDLAEILSGHSSEEVLVPTEATDTAVVLYTSGTTGKPKGAELTHANLVTNSLACHRLFGTLDEVQLVTLPLFHSFAQTVQMNAGFSQCGTLVLLPRFDARVALDLVRGHHVTVFAGVPTMYWALLGEAAHRDDIAELGRQLKVAMSGGAALPVELLKRFEAVFGVGIREGYGLSETSPVVAFNRLDRPSRPGSIGMPVWGVELGLRGADGRPVAPGERGELVVRGHNVMKGYLGRPAATAEVLDVDGWFRTGDIATRDADGFYYIVDRAKDLIVRGGFNVYPREVEEILMTHPAVGLAAVVGIADERVGEEIKAFIIARPGAALTEQDVLTWCRDRLAVYKCPRAVQFCDEFPLNATGKVLKQELRNTLNSAIA